MQLPSINSRVTFRYILLVLWGVLVHSENDIDTETAIAGSATNIKCHFAPTDSDYIVAWVLNDGTVMNYNSLNPLEHEGKRRFPVVDQAGSKVHLEILNVTFEDAGLYTCQRYSIKGGTVPSRNNTLHVQGDIQIKVDRNVTLDDPITAACCVRSTKSVNGVPFVWYIGNVWSVHDQFEETVYMDSDMKYCRNTTITSVKRFHKLFLGCSISSELNITSKRPLNIFYPASVQWIPLTNTPTPIIVDRNQKVTITCFSDGNPSPSVLLQKKTSENQWMDLLFNETFWHVADNFWMFSYNITEEKTCALRCFATNDFGESSASDVISIEVFVGLMAVILANLKLVVIGCVGLLLLLMVICFLALKKRKRIRYRLSAEANRLLLR